MKRTNFLAAVFFLAGFVVLTPPWRSTLVPLDVSFSAAPDLWLQSLRRLPHVESVTGDCCGDVTLDHHQILTLHRGTP